MRLLDVLRSRSTSGRVDALSFEEYLQAFNYNGSQYVVGFGSNLKTDREHVERHYQAVVQSIARRHGVVPAAVFVRALVLSGLRFQWRDVVTGRLFGNEELAVLERPDPAGDMTINELLARLENHQSYGGTGYVYRSASDRLELLDPGRVVVYGVMDRVTKNLTLSRFELFENRAGVGDPIGSIPADRVVVWPGLDVDPASSFLGLSWVQSVLDELETDTQKTQYVSKFFENGAAPSVLVGVPKEFDREQVEQFAALAREEYAGVSNAHKMAFIGAASDVQVVGSKMNDLALKDLGAQLEGRFAARSRVPAVILGVPTDAVIGGSALNAGNYGATRRVWADTWFTPTVQALCRKLQKIVPPPPGAELWYDTSDVLFLQEDRKDEADIQMQKIAAITAAVRDGFTPESVVETIAPEWADTLTHTGNLSVQLLPPGEAGVDVSGGDPAGDDGEPSDGTDDS